MGFNNPPWSWKELEAALSGRAPLQHDGREPGSPSWNAGGDGPAWTRRRQPYRAAGPRRHGEVPYAELHCHSNFSFGDGASPPERLVATAAELGLEAIALTDHDNFAGVVRFAEAAREHGMRAAYGMELTLAPDIGPNTRVARPERETVRQVATGRLPDTARPDPPGAHLLVLADQGSGYARLSRTASLGLLAGEKGVPRFTLADVADGVAGHAWVLTGCRKGAVPAALEREGPSAARRELERLVEAFGRDRVLVELWDHGDPLDTARNDALAESAARVGVGVVATNNVHYAAPAERRLAAALAAVRSRRSLAELDGWLPAAATAHLRSGAEQARRFRRYPGVVERAAELGLAAAFDLELIAPELPPFRCPDGLTEMQYLRRLVEEGGLRLYGSRAGHPEAWKALDHELGVIEQLGYPGYFLVVWELVAFCREHDIFCQGRGSAANSAVCYALGITKVDPVGFGLLFERFLSPERDGPPDIDVDIESDRREEVIQHVYAQHGRWHTAQVANVITYRARSAVRDMARALGYSPGQQDAWARRVDAWGSLGRLSSTGSARPAEPDRAAPAEPPAPRSARAAPRSETHDLEGIPAEVLELAVQLEGAPRHLGIHSGGMVICDRPVVEVCPVEWARMDQRSVIQWDKDDCAAVGLIKFDLLGLGMLSALHYMVDLVAAHRGYTIDLARLPERDPDVYDMLCRADTVGVFQVESRAQMATLPRLKPDNFYDLVVEIALIRPGPIQGGSVHPYLRRRAELEPVSYPHPLAERSLKRTFGVPLFQEQLMSLAIDLAGFSPAEADQLRTAMSSKRSADRMERLRERLYAGMADNGITGATADDLYAKMLAFANYGFPESHAMSFAHMVYSSAYLKFHEPAAFLAGLLNAQPMGFWSPHTLVGDARRHGVVVRTPDLGASLAGATLEPCEGSAGGVAVRLGLGPVRGLGATHAEAIVAARAAGGPFAGLEDLVRRVPSLELPQLEALATAGAFGECFGLGRREALWAVGSVVQSRPGRLPGVVTGTRAPCLPGMAPVEEAIADLWSTGIAPDGHPTVFLRGRLADLGVTTAAGLQDVEPGSRVTIAGTVTHRQRPMTAGGTTFLSIEDETGLINVVVSKGCWSRFRKVARQAQAMTIRGRLERAEGVVNLIAEHLAELDAPAPLKSRDFR